MFVGTIALTNLVHTLATAHQVNTAVMENVPYVVPLVRLIASAHQVNIVVVVVKIAIVLDLVLENRVKIVTTAH
jgi:hypothetical protein